MKRIFLFICVSSFLLCKCFANGTRIGGIYYLFDKEQAIVTYTRQNEDDISKYSNSIIIPSYVNYNGQRYPVTKIGKYAFYKAENLKSITIPNSVVEIENYAFSKCTNLKDVSLSEGLKIIGPAAFGFCDKIETLDIPESVLEIRRYAFRVCKKLKTISIPPKVTVLSDGIFASCESLEHIDIPYGVVSVGESAFFDCSMLKKIQLPESVTSIGEYAFWSCDSLMSVNIPNRVTRIEKGTFRFCKQLDDIILPNSLTFIGDDAFCGCEKLSKIHIPASVAHISENAFGLFCDALVAIEVDKANTHYRTINNVLYSYGTDTLFKCPSNTVAVAFTIPNTVKRIGVGAFYNCKSLQQIIIPNSVKSIGERAFSFTECQSLTIPYSVEQIDNSAFSYSEIVSITILNPNTKLGEDVFEYAYAYKTGKNIVHVPQSAYAYFSSIIKLRNGNVVGDVNDNISYTNSTNTTPISKNFPLLALVPNSIQFIETNPNKTIDANEQCFIQFQVINNGRGPATGCEARLKATGSVVGLSYDNVKLPTIAVGATYVIEILVNSNINTQDGNVSFSIEVREPNGFGISPITLTVNTSAFNAPLLKVVDYMVSGNGTIQKMQPFDLQLLLQNTKYGKAEDVDVFISLPAGVYLWNGEEKTHYSTLNGGEQQKLNYQLAISGNYAETTVPINISIKEKYGKFAENKTINLALNQQLASATSVTLQGQQPQVQREAIAIGALGSAVDKNIPVSQMVNKNTFVVIIANENYMSVAGVPFALNDGMKFREYCQKTLGIPEKNIKYVANATGNQIKAQVQWLENITNVFDDPNIIFYYAGHGIPDESSKTAYLLPVDGIGTDVSTGYKLDNLYAALGKMPSAHTTIFLDACFSGSKREEGMLASARGVAIKAKSGVPQGNMVVFSAAQGDETAYPNNDEGHGLFTYFLLKKLQETSGDVTLYDLGNYITKNVSQQSILLNGKSQTPCVTASSAIGSDWQNWKLK